MRGFCTDQAETGCNLQSIRYWVLLHYEVRSITLLDKYIIIYNAVLVMNKQNPISWFHDVIKFNICEKTLRPNTLFVFCHLDLGVEIVC